MNAKTTLWLVVFAGALFAFIFFYERHHSTQKQLPPARLLPDFSAAKVSKVQVRRGNQFAVRAQRTNDGWVLDSPLVYPARAGAIDSLLKKLEDLVPQTQLSAEDLSAHNQSAAQFGFADPSAVVVLEHGTDSREIQFGATIPASDLIYVRVVGTTRIHVVKADLLAGLPRTPNDWRDPALLDLNGLKFDRFEIRPPARGFAIQANRTNQNFYLHRSGQIVRADFARLKDLFLTITACRVAQFETDDPHADLERFGLQPPDLEMVLLQGTNEVAVVQFGKSPTNDSTQVYARRLSQTNVVRVSRQLIETLRVPFSEWRDHRLLPLDPETVDTIEVRGEENFLMRRQTNGVFTITGPENLMADSVTVREWLGHLSGLVVTNFVKDGVTDFAVYGLAKPVRQYSFKTAATNAATPVTNLFIPQLDFGAIANQEVFVRRSDEDSVYAIPQKDYLRMPSAVWQFRDRRVWSFDPTNVIRVTIKQKGQTRQFLRNPENEWTSTAGQGDYVNPFSVEETLFRLGQLQAVHWTARGETNRAALGFSEDGHEIILELKGSDKAQTLTLEFGGRSARRSPYAAVKLDGQLWFFEFPLPLYADVLRDLTIPPKAAAANRR
jgi:hypothetical protein